jgi:hypothetical protein
MTKNDIANKINYKADLTRIIVLNYKGAFKVGNVYDNRGKAESWMCSDSTEDFDPELENSVEYVLYVNNIDCHKVDYDNDEECDVLDANGCESEGECLLPAETKLKIISVSSDEDFEEMGFYEVELEKINLTVEE